MTPNFKRAEFLVSQTARELGISNEPGRAAELRIAQVAYALECLRAGAYDDRAMILLSGFRNEAVNRAVGGVGTSDHMSGGAVDYRVAGLTAREAAIRARDWFDRSRAPFDQLILETSRNIVHLSIDPRYRRQVLTQPGGPGTPVYAGIK